MTSRAWATGLFLALTLPGCASYQASPLRPISVDSLLAPIDPSEVSTRTAQVIRSISEGQAVLPQQLAEASLELNSEVKSVRARAESAKAQTLAAGLMPDPHLDLSLEHPQDASLVNGIVSAISNELSALVTRGARRAGAAADLERVRQEVAWNDWLHMHRVLTSAVQVASLRRQHAIARESLDILQRRLRITEEHVSAGDATVDEAGVVRAAWMDAQVRSFDIDRALSNAQLDLNSAAGLPIRTRINLKHDELVSSCVVSEETLVATALNARSDLRALRAGYLAKESGVKLAVQASWPLPQLSISRTRDTGGIWSWGAGIGMGIPLWNRGRGEIAIAQADRAQLQLEYEARVRLISEDIVALGQDVRILCAQQEELEEALAPLMSIVSKLTAGADQADVDLLRVESIRASLLDKKLSLEGVRRALAETRVALEAAVGSP